MIVVYIMVTSILCIMISAVIISNQERKEKKKNIEYDQWYHENIKGINEFDRKFPELKNIWKD